MGGHANFEKSNIIVFLTIRMVQACIVWMVKI